MVNVWETAINKRSERISIRQTIKELSALSDRELDDIGITRGQIFEIAQSSK